MVEVNEEKSCPKEEKMIFYGTKEVAEILRCSIPTARDVMSRADFPLIMVGRNMMVSKVGLEKWSLERRT